MEKIKYETTGTSDLIWGSQPYDYMVDRTQRAVLFWDVLRKRGITYLAHLKEGQPAILIFNHKEIMDGLSSSRLIIHLCVF